MATPVVGITLRPYKGGSLPPVLMRNRAYYDALEDSGAAVMSLPVGGDAAAMRVLYERCDALCVAGGPDVQPALYGEEERPDCSVDAAPELDTVETQLIQWALDDGKPLLAICRGLQVLNVALGGTLWQDLTVQVEGTLQHKHDDRHHEVLHDLRIEPGSRMHDIARADTALVNSRHHQGVHVVAPALRVTARAPDGVVEALEDPARSYLLAVQCHPEDLYTRMGWSRRLFADFVRAAGS